jgi:hypothetical protein
LCACCDVLVQLVEGGTASNAKSCHKRRQPRPQRHLYSQDLDPLLNCFVLLLI